MHPSEFDLDLFFSPCLPFFSYYKNATSMDPFIIHLATAGGKIPESICENSGHSRIRRHLKNLPDSFLLEAQVSENLAEIFARKRQINPEFDEASYMKDFIS